MKTKILLLGFALAAMTAAAQIPTNGLVAYYPFNGNANDASANGNNGTVNGATLTTDRFGNANSAYSFNGTSSYIEIPHNSNFNLQDSITLSVWINTTNVNLGQRILDKSTGGTSNGWLLDLSPNPSDLNKVRCIVGGATSNLPYSNPNISQNNNWYYVAVTYDHKNVKFYINGILNNTIPLTTSTPITTHPVRIGITTSLGAGFFSGKIDDVAFYNRALSSTEISQLYNQNVCYKTVYDTIKVSTQVPTTGLVAYYPFNGNANDASANGNNGTVNGATLTTDRFGNANSAYSFDGQSNYIEIPHSSAFNSKLISIGFWSKFSFAATSLGGGPNVNPAIISKLPNQVPIASIDWVFYEIGGGISCSGNLSGNGCCMNDGQWKFNLLTVDIDSSRFYVNGLKVSTWKVTGINNTTNPIRIGRSLNTYWKGFNGVVDDIVIYNRALTPTEITQLYTGKVDTCFVTIHDTVHVSVTDTLIINAKLTGITPPNNVNTIKVYPNPTNDKVIINTGSYSTMSNYTIKITNVLSQVVFSSKITQQQYTIDLNSFGGKGTYFIELYDNSNQKIDVRKIILQ